MTANDDFLKALPVSSPPSTAINAAPKGGLRRKTSTFAPWMTDVACTALAEGMYTELVANLLGVSLRTFERWRSEGGREDKDGNPLCKDELLVDFAVRTSQARAEALAGGFRILKGHGIKDWRAHQLVMQIQDPEGPWNPANRSKLDVTISQGAPEEDLTGLSDEALAAKALYEEELARVKGLPRG